MRIMSLIAVSWLCGVGIGFAGGMFWPKQAAVITAPEIAPCEQVTEKCAQAAKGAPFSKRGQLCAALQFRMMSNPLSTQDCKDILEAFAKQKNF